MMLSETEYMTLVNATLTTIAETVEDADAEGALSVEFSEGIVEITLKDKRQYVINMHKPTQQIWMASPKSGASYFVYDLAASHWRSKKGPLLYPMLEEELQHLAGIRVAFS